MRLIDLAIDGVGNLGNLGVQFQAQLVLGRLGGIVVHNRFKNTCKSRGK